MRGHWLTIGCVAGALSGCGDDGGEAADTGPDSSSGDPIGTTGGGSTDDSTTAALDDTSSGGDESSSSGELPDPLPPLDQAPLTTEQTIVLTHEVGDASMDPRDPAALTAMLGAGFGEHDVGPGEPILDLTPDGSDPPPGDATFVTRFVHLADTQLPDDESPLRLANYDSTSITGGFRAHEAYECKILDAAVRTINAVNLDFPLDFVVLGGDNTDAAQTNELGWFLGILGGAPAINCDSGADDDLVPGPDNDPKDRFAPVGLDVPWVWVTGNHDKLVQGNFTVESRGDAAIGDSTFADGATRDYSQPGGPLTQETIVPDEERVLLSATELLAAVASDGDGHGVDDDTASSGYASFAWDMQGTDVRLIVVDTAAPSGGAEGLVRQTHVDDVLTGLFDDAEAAGKRVVVVSHHASGSLNDGGGLGGTEQADALTPAEWQSFLGTYPNILMHLCGHSHLHRVLWMEPIGGNPYWEVLTSALADWPHQMRLMELAEVDGGWWTISSIAFDYSVEGDPLAAEGLEVSLVDFTSGWAEGGPGLPTDRNVRLWVPPAI